MPTTYTQAETDKKRERDRQRHTHTQRDREPNNDGGRAIHRDTGKKYIDTHRQQGVGRGTTMPIVTMKCTQ